MRLALCALCAALVAACATIPPPEVLDRIDRVRAAPAAKEAEEHAPDAYAEAERLREQARATFEAGDVAGAQIRGEQALAAYARAVAVARAAKADARRLESKKAADAAEKRLAELESAHQQVAADIEALEDRLEVLEHVETPHAAGEASGRREQARREAAESLRLQARMLCAGAGLLAASFAEDDDFEPPAALATAEKHLGELESLADEAAAAPIDEARRARADCLHALTLVRRAGNDPSRAPGRADALLAALSKLGIGKPGRDDRGVVLTLRDLFEGRALSAEGEERLSKLIAALEPFGDFPVMIVVHHDPGASDRWGARAEALVSRLRGDLGDDRVGEPQLAGDAVPVVDPAGPTPERNQRVELVFVTPESF